MNEEFYVRDFYVDVDDGYPAFRCAECHQFMCYIEGGDHWSLLKATLEPHICSSS